MKTNKFILSAGRIARAMAGCTDLDVNVDSMYTVDPSKDGGMDPMIVVEAKMADVYFHLAGTLGRRYMEAQALASDEFTCLAFDGGYYDAGTYAHTALHCSSAEDASLDWYSEVTAGITKANVILDELGSGASVAMTAPARAIRAYYTWILMDSFGDAPILEGLAAEGVVTPRSPRKEVALWIEKELNAIIPELTTEVNANTYGKPTKWMAEALLAKLYLNWAVYTAESVDQYDAASAYNEKLGDCITVCEDIIGSGKFSLGSMEYRFKFAPNNGPQVEDFIYAMPYDAIERGGMQYARPRSFKDLKNMVPNYYGSTDKFSQSFGGNMVVNTTMTTGNLTAFVTYISQILFSLTMVTMMFVFMSRAIASGKRIAEVLDEQPDIADNASADKNLTVKNGDIVFDNVSFRYYKNSEEKVLDGINLHIGAGQTVGIIGSTGCGKTTLVSMIARLYDTDEGSVKIDGVNVRDYSLYHLREGVGMVLQKNVLFSGSIEDNLRWGDPDATMEEIRACADAAQADGFVTGFTNGYQMDLGQGGTNVSGGQKQRLCIARALLKKPKILILDDSTSAVDTATEARIRQAFRTSLRDSTKIIIAQRISSVMEADKIIVMNDGKITGIGTHDELLAGNIEYQEIYNSQMEANKQAPAPAVSADAKEVLA